MGNYNVGDMIRLSRIAKKMTQEELSEGVCSVETLSRIENGKHKVKSDTYRIHHAAMSCCNHSCQ